MKTKYTKSERSEIGGGEKVETRTAMSVSVGVRGKTSESIYIYAEEGRKERSWGEGVIYHVCKPLGSVPS